MNISNILIKYLNWLHNKESEYILYVYINKTKDMCILFSVLPNVKANHSTYFHGDNHGS